MRKIILNKHSQECCNSNNVIKDWYNPHKFCVSTPKKLLFYFNGEFVYFEYFDCFTRHYNEQELIEYIINNKISTTKKMQLWECSRSWNLDEKLKEFRLRNIDIKYKKDEVNFIYSDAAGKQYAVVTEIPYKDAFINNDKLENEYNEMYNFLFSSDDRRYLIPLLKELNSNNYIHISDNEIVKSIEHMRKILIKNNKNETSKQ